MLKTLKFIPLLWLLTACVTINIYFPAAQAEEEADKIIENILGNGKQVPEKKPTPDDKQSAIPVDAEQSFTLLDLFFPAAHAASAPNFSVNTPKVRKLEAQMKDRHAKLAPFYRSGAVGFANNGLIAIHSSQKIGLRDKKKLSVLMSSENNDRNAMYKEIARANGHPEWEQQVRDVFASRWIKKAQKGWWYQTSKGSWKQR